MAHPDMSASDIANTLTKSGIATVSVEDLSAPTADLARAVYSSVLDYFLPLHDGANEQLDFGALQLLDNPEQHEDAINTIVLYHRMKEFLISIGCNGFRLSDLLRPEPHRMIVIFSAVVNFLYYREEKLTTIQLVLDKVPACEERKSELEERLAELKKQYKDYEVARETEEPMVHEMESEVNKLKQSIQDYNKQQMEMRNQAKELKEKTDAIDAKISQEDFELLKKAEENSKLSSNVVQSPQRLQGALEEKRKKIAEVKNSAKVSIQHVQEKKAILERYTKASKKISKLSSQVQATQEQINSAKNVEKDVKALKAKLSDDAISNMAAEAKLFELQGKANQAEELLRAAESEHSERCSEDTHKLHNVSAKVDNALKSLKTKEVKLEDMIARSESLRLEADKVREAEKLKQQQLLLNLEEVVLAFHSYSNRMNNFLEHLGAEVTSKQ